MRIIFITLTWFIIIGIFPRSAHAIIVFPALILIPIIKIVAVIIGGLTLPTTIIGLITAKIKRKPAIKMLVISLTALVIIGIVLAVFIKIINPYHPWI